MAAVDWKAGMRITADRMRASVPQAWTTWTPTWDTVTGSALPSYGNAGVTGEYVQFGQLCMGRLEIQFGSTTSFGVGATGSDNWQFSTPITAADTTLIAGWGELQDDGGNNRCGTRIRMNTVDTFGLEISSGGVNGAAITNIGVVDASAPWTWQSGDWIRFFFMYETAS
ncbi:hypothetical protein LHJ74_14775 [Streptomyces sp. N2-109]|uniref:Uncharacterized protein n=1 Tax=Streptomyces gossypii TaxID=2883101 RepID=A0ABT2JTD7_9ACTN|nr:hypothetical protein [Streptomyces gossypii]MCT2591156.1 hypothetical protein [Streptomyces gossypii]